VPSSPRTPESSSDFFVVPTLTFRLLFAFVVLRHDRRQLVHLNVTNHPTVAWTARQLVEAFPDDTAPPYLLRDRDGVYGEEFVRHVQGLGIREVLTAPRAHWQNRLLRAYVAYYNGSRPHQALENNSPIPREVQPPSGGRLRAVPEVGGLHDRYQRVA